jgi:hypothetical protein
LKENKSLTDLAKHTFYYITYNEHFKNYGRKKSYNSQARQLTSTSACI